MKALAFLIASILLATCSRGPVYKAKAPLENIGHRKNIECRGVSQSMTVVTPTGDSNLGKVEVSAKACDDRWWVMVDDNKLILTVTQPSYDEVFSVVENRADFLLAVHREGDALNIITLDKGQGLMNWSRTVRTNGGALLRSQNRVFACH